MTGQPHSGKSGQHARAARHTSPELVRGWLKQGRIWYLPLLLSDYAQELMARKYDAFATDRAYENRPSGRLGPLGSLVDWFVLHQDIHIALRERLHNVVAESGLAVTELWTGGRATVRLASGPCGLARDLRLIWQALGAPEGRLELIGLDLDEGGEVLPAAGARSLAAGVPLRTVRCDLLDSTAVRDALDRQPVDIFLCIGLTVWLDLAELERLLGNLHAVVQPDGFIQVDHFRALATSVFARDFEMEPHYHARADFEAALVRARLAIEDRRPTSRSVNTLYRCRRLP